MSSERPKRGVPKINYFALHSGRSGSESGSDIEVEVGLSVNNRDSNFKPLNNTEVLVAETPLQTPTIPETQETMSLQEEMDEAKLVEEQNRLDQEQAELAARAKALSETMKLEAKERQISLLKDQIAKL